MDEQMKSRLTSKDVWIRGLYMVFFALAWSLSEVLLVFSVIFQFLTVLITGSANLPLLRFGQNLARYHYQIAQFVSFNSEERPFPFADWPAEEPGGERWMDSAEAVEGTVAEEAPTPESSAAARAEMSDPDSAAEESETSAVSASRKDEAPPPA